MAKKQINLLDSLNEGEVQTLTPTEQIIVADKKETKSVRYNLLLRPSLKADIETLAHIKKTSANDLINSALAEYISNYKEDIETYNKLF